MKNRAIPLLESIVAICIILNCESVWCWMYHNGYFKLGIFLLFTVALSLLIIFIKPKTKQNNTITLLLIYFYMLFFLVLNITNLYNSVQFAIVGILLAIYCARIGAYGLFDKISKILTLLALLSLFFFVFGSVMHILIPGQSLTVVTNNMQIIRRSYFFLSYEIQPEATFGMNLFRNTGIFIEAPKYALILSFALMYELFISKKPSFKRSMIFTITILTTISLTGVFAAAIIWILHFLFKYPFNNLKGLAIRCIFIIALLIVGQHFVNIFQGIMDIKSQTSSYLTRMDDFRAGLVAWKENVFFGAGYLNTDTIISDMSAFRINNTGFSNSIFRVLAQGGIYLFVLYLIPILHVIIKGIKNIDMFVLCFAGIFIYLFITTSFPYNYIAILILCYFMFYKKMKTEKSEKIKNVESRL